MLVVALVLANQVPYTKSVTVDWNHQGNTLFEFPNLPQLSHSNPPGLQDHHLGTFTPDFLYFVYFRIRLAENRLDNYVKIYF